MFITKFGIIFPSATWICLFFFSILTKIMCLPLVFHTSSYWADNPNNMWWRVSNTKVVIIQFLPISSHFFFFLSLMNPGLKTSSRICIETSFGWLSLHFIWNNTRETSAAIKSLTSLICIYDISDGALITATLFISSYGCFPGLYHNSHEVIALWTQAMFKLRTKISSCHEKQKDWIIFDLY